ncbi:DUF4433 domain-containing protein [Trinickia sp. EG282A]|uniref:DUF4433 domain-containing protein n=1 Tax=Trinickia sp. EG282A TaxID=3237013 RepID=UPI0034D21228
MDPRVTEFHCIMPIVNLPSVLQYGIVSYEQAARLAHKSVAMQPVQDRRDQKHVPRGLKLHQYANLYFHARNPMMSKRRDEAGNLCVLRVSVAVLGIEGTVIADQNASSDYVRFLAPQQMDEWLNYDRIFARDWTDDDQITYWRKKSAKCAEVLVPHRVDAALVFGAYARDATTARRVQAGWPNLQVTVDADMFFS